MRPTSAKKKNEKNESQLGMNRDLRFDIGTIFEPLKMVVTSAESPPNIFDRKIHVPSGAQPA
jgi:hypothetical protein